MSEEKKQKEPTIEKLKEELEECQRLNNEYLTGWQRARADFINYQKDEIQRIGELIKYADCGLILRILPILDNFEVAEKKLPEDLKNNDNIKGLLQIKTQLQDFLKSRGVEEIKCLGEKFDLNFQQVVEVIEAKDKKPETVIEVVEKGYKIDGKLLRPAKVRISK